MVLLAILVLEDITVQEEPITGLKHAVQITILLSIEQPMLMKQNVLLVLMVILQIAVMAHVFEKV